MAKVYKWAEIARTNTPVRYDVLSEYLTKNGVENQVDYIEVSPAEFEGQLKEALEKYDAIRLASPYGLMSLKHFTGQPAEIVHLNAADSIIKRKGEWQLSASNLESLKYVLKKHGPSIDLKSSALIVGSGAAARFSIYALLKIGVKDFKISNQFHEQAQETIRELEKKYFDVQFNFIPEDEIVLLPGTNSILINTTPAVESNTILTELYYFNFLKTDGIVFDFNFLPTNTILVKEAEEIGIQAVRGYEIHGWGDVHWVKDWLGIDIDFVEYQKLLHAAAEKWEQEQSTENTNELNNDDSENKDSKPTGPRF